MGRLRVRLPAGRRFMSHGPMVFNWMELAAIPLMLAILACIVFATTRPEKTPLTEALTDIETIEQALRAYHRDTGRYPDTLDALVKRPGKEENRRTGGYLRSMEVLKDPWGNPYRYTRTVGNVHIVTYGRDGLPGGTGYDADISNNAPQYNAGNRDHRELSWIELARIMRWSCVY